MIAQRSYDCLVMGAGPAGCCAAALVAESGFSTLLVERDKMPRFHVGESLMPETYWAFERLGILDEMLRIAFTRKNGVQFVNADDKETQPFIFSEFDEHPSAVTWHVERAKFDQLLLDTAYNRGATVVDETRVLDIELKKSPPHKVMLKLANGREQEVSARVVVDATGQQSLIANRLGLREYYEDLKKAAVWTYFEGARRNGGANPEVTCILHTRNKEAWFWYIPLSDGTVSVGLVGDNEYVLKRGGSPESRFREEMKNCPGILRRTQDARIVSRFHVAKEFSYITKKQAGDGWVLIGDAAGFIDPIYSSGVFLALKSATMAADAVISGLASGNVSARVLGSWTEQYENGVAPIRKLVRAFYTKPFSFGEFIRTFPHHRENLVRLLVGKTFEGNPHEIFEDMDPWIEDLKQKSAPALA
ncbi:MAG TPA: NAD(P)/FAD-dependent oxidoreductase [Pirellulaceae bacterium]|nr:NAD(P)/FAD-dependent oxidoreductase [Pirellulaceae bacterium]